MSVKASLFSFSTQYLVQLPSALLTWSLTSNTTFSTFKLLANVFLLLAVVILTSLTISALQHVLKFLTMEHRNWTFLLKIQSGHLDMVTQSLAFVISSWSSQALVLTKTMLAVLMSITTSTWIFGLTNLI